MSSIGALWARIEAAKKRREIAALEKRKPSEEEKAEAARLHQRHMEQKEAMKKALDIDTEEDEPPPKPKPAPKPAPELDYDTEEEPPPKPEPAPKPKPEPIQTLRTGKPYVPVKWRGIRDDLLDGAEVIANVKFIYPQTRKLAGINNPVTGKPYYHHTASTYSDPFPAWILLRNNDEGYRIFEVGEDKSLGRFLGYGDAIGEFEKGKQPGLLEEGILQVTPKDKELAQEFSARPFMG